MSRRQSGRRGGSPSGRHSGSDGVREKLKSMGMQVTDEELAAIIKALKTMPVDASPIDNGGLLAFVKAVLNRKD